MITVIGSLNMDLVTYTKYFPAPGETITASRYAEIPGGKGANQAVTIGKLEGSVEMIGAVGCDSLGQKLLLNLSTNHVGISGIKQCHDFTTGTAFINVEEAGDNKIILVPGANYALTTADIDAHQHLIEGSDMVILQLEIPLETVTHALQLAHSLGKTTLLNPAPARSLDPSLFQFIDILTPNETELAILTGMPTDTIENVRVAANTLIAQGIETIVVTIGEKGAVVVQKDLCAHIPGHIVTAVDTTAAGDSFTGALALAFTQGKSLGECICFANTVASITVQREGAQISLPTRAEVDEQTLY